MSKTITVDVTGTLNYDIRITDGFQELTQLLKPFLSEKKKAAVITDSNVSGLYSENIEEAVRSLGNDCYTFVFDAGEENKDLDTVQDLYAFLIKNKFERRDILIALGGGVVGDLTGFAAATYLRGVDFIQIPTTLLAQTDSSIGGKTGVDFRGFKNMVGAFHQPRLVYMNMDTLKTLDNRQFLSGLGEVIKAALIKDFDFFEWIEASKEKISNRDNKTLEEMIYRACLIKRNVVENDPKEKGERALLNFGHTLGHAIEKCANFSYFHGECVVLGMKAALFMSKERGEISGKEYKRILDLFDCFGYTLSVSGLSKDEIISTARSDKKMEAGVIKFILLEKPGEAVIKKDVTEDEMSRALDEVLL